MTATNTHKRTIDIRDHTADFPEVEVMSIQHVALPHNNMLSNTSREEEIPEEKGKNEQSSIKHESSIKMHDKRKSFAAMSDQDD